MTLYDELGGSAVVKTAVTVFYHRVLEDPELAQWFDGVDLDRLRAHQRAFLTTALGGPHIFNGRALEAAHAGMEITDTAFTAIVEHLATALRDLDIEEEAIEAIGERLEGLRDRIVTAPEP